MDNLIKLEMRKKSLEIGTNLFLMSALLVLISFVSATGNNKLLHCNIHSLAANVFLARLSEDGVPYWGFDGPAISIAPKDASVAAVAACGILELAVTLDEVAAEKYKNTAKALIENLSTNEYLSGDTNKAMLLHLAGHHPRGTGIDVPIIYADYYLMEALLRLKKLEE